MKVRRQGRVKGRKGKDGKSEGDGEERRKQKGQREWI